MARSGGDGLKYWALRQGGSPESIAKADSLRVKLVMHRKRMQAERSDVQAQADAGHSVPDMTWAENVPRCPVYYPTSKEFEEPLDYIQSIAPEASKYGICKIVSPLVPAVSAGHVLTREKSGFKFTPRVQPMRLSNWDTEDMHKFLMSGQQYTFNEYEKMANKFYSRRFGSSACLSPKTMEAEFWKELSNGKINVEYGCDIEGSAFSSSPKDPLGRSKWNLNRLPHLAESTLRHLETAIPGVTEPMLYIGMAFAMFAWHVEDHYLFSVNYHHCGAPKTWYGVPGHAAPDFEKVVRDHVYAKELLAAGQEGLAYDLLIGKTTIFSPRLLVEHNVPTYRAIQAPGEFVITFPRAYHAGFSHGFNCSEAVNFAMGDWLQFGAAACRRYELLNRVSLLPHEELLCKEAMRISAEEALYKGSQNAVAAIGEHALKRQQGVKVAFAVFMRFQHQVRWLLQRRGAQTISRSPGFDGSVMCGLCKHMCYFAFVTCRCSQTPMCLNHANEIRQCSCGASRSVVLLEGLPELEKTALRYLEEEVVRSDVCRGPAVDIATTLIGIKMEESMLETEDYKMYIPFGGHLGAVKVPSASVKMSGSTTVSIAGRKPSGVAKPAPLQSASRSPLSAVFRGGHSSSSSTISGIRSKPRELIDDGSSNLCGGGRVSGSVGTCHWSKEFDKIRQRVPETKVERKVPVPASAKRKRSLTITRKTGPGGKAHLTARGAYIDDRIPLDRISDDEDDEDDDEDEEYWP